MWTELILFGIILVLLGGFGWYVREQERFKSKLINAILAKDGNEFRDLELTDKVKPIKPPIQTPPDFVPESELTDEEFSKLHNIQLNQELNNQ